MPLRLNSTCYLNAMDRELSMRFWIAKGIRCMLFVVCFALVACEQDHKVLHNPNISNNPYSIDRHNGLDKSSEKSGLSVLDQHQSLHANTRLNSASKKLNTRSNMTSEMASKVVKVDIVRLLVAEAVKKRRAIGISQSFPTNIGAVWSLAEVYAQGGTAELEMRWWRGEEQVSVSSFVVAEGLKWREWSKVTIQPHQTGQWRVEVYQPQSQTILATYYFNVNAKPDKKTQQLAHSEQNKPAKSSTKSLVQEHIEKNKATPLSKKDHQAHESNLQIKNLLIATKIKRRKPIGVSSKFSLNNERLWGYVEATNIDHPQFIWMEWYRGDVLRSKLKVRVGVSKRWRTWSWQRLGKLDEGTWSVKVLDLSGGLLAQTQFVVMP